MPEIILVKYEGLKILMLRTEVDGLNNLDFHHLLFDHFLK